MPRPALTEMLAVKKPIHQSLVSVRSRIVDESADFLRARRQADQVKINATDQPLFAHRRIRRDASRLHLGQHEPINRSPAPSFIPPRTRSRGHKPPERLERPELPILFGNRLSRPGFVVDFVLSD